MQRELTIIEKDPDIQLQAEIFLPADNNGDFAVLLTHPHPQFGGAMTNNVVSALFSIFIDENIPVLRFNFRGIGKSTGSYGNDDGEQEDVRSCIEYLIQSEGFKRLVIVGYSYGSAIGCSIINEYDNIFAYVAIAFPFDMFIKFKDLSQSPKPKLFIQGDRDNIASYYAFSNHYDDMEPPKDQKIINNCDHFYLGHESTVAKYALDFVKSVLKEK